MKQPDLFTVMLQVLCGVIIVYCILQGLIVPAIQGAIRLVQGVMGG